MVGCLKVVAFLITPLQISFVKSFPAPLPDIISSDIRDFFNELKNKYGREINSSLTEAEENQRVLRLEYPVITVGPPVNQWQSYRLFPTDAPTSSIEYPLSTTTSFDDSSAAAPPGKYLVAVILIPIVFMAIMWFACHVMGGCLKNNGHSISPLSVISMNQRYSTRHRPESISSPSIDLPPSYEPPPAYDIAIKARK